MNRSFVFVGILVFLVGAIAYTTYRIWHILPLPHWGKSAVAALWELFQADDRFTIVLDHQPYHLEEAEEAGADFQFSGHTHHGQIWPGNWLTDAMYEKAFGAYQRGDTRYYISSGMGIWGGKFRIGTRSEYIVLKLRPAKAATS